METLQREHGGRALQNGWEKNLGEDRKIPKPNKKYLSNEEEDSTTHQWWGGGGGKMASCKDKNYIFSFQ